MRNVKTPLFVIVNFTWVYLTDFTSPAFTIDPALQKGTAKHVIASCSSSMIPVVGMVEGGEIVVTNDWCNIAERRFYSHV